MTYATQQDLIDRYGEDRLIALTDRADVPTGAIDATLVAEVLADTDALINGYLKVRYALPVAAVPPLIEKLAKVIAYYDLHLYDTDDKTKADYERAMVQLKQISDGTIKLSIAGIEPQGSNTDNVMVTDRARPLTAENLKGLI